MFELATVNDLIDLKARHMDKWYPEEHQWGLKQLGTLFCYDRLLGEQGCILEVGAGLNRFFDTNLPASIDYWAIDSSRFFGDERFQHSASQRKRTTLVDGMLGDFAERLPPNQFNAVFSISVLEHVPVAKIPDVCRDMHRVLKSGGKIFHTLDLTPKNYETVGKKYLETLTEIGFQFEKEPNVNYQEAATQAVLFEPAAIVFKYYFGRRPDPWENPAKINQHTCSIKIVARKP